VLRHAKAATAAATVGDERRMRRAMDEARTATTDLQIQYDIAAESWTFDVASYLRGPEYLAEVQEAGRSVGLTMWEQDGRLFCYPVLLRAVEGGVMLDRKREAGVRPSNVVRLIRTLRERPQRFQPSRFIETLYRAYEVERRSRGDNQSALDGMGPVVELRRIHELLTLLSNDYTLAEFTRDLYLLDQSRQVETTRGARMELSAASGTRHQSRVLQIVDEAGRSRLYYGIAFGRV
jgi:hypothetical protein